MLEVENIAIDLVHSYSRNARTHSEKQITQIARSIQTYGFNNPILVDKTTQIIAGHGRYLAAKSLGLSHVPVIRLEHMTDEQKRAYILADNKLAEKAGWDSEILKIELQSLIELDTDFDLTLTGFETPEIDLILNGNAPVKASDPLDTIPDSADVPEQVRSGDVWRLGSHYLYCGDSRRNDSFLALLGEKRADLIFADPPYNVKIQGHVCGSGSVQHAEFVCASGEMSSQEFTNFLEQTLSLLAQYSKPGSIHFICMDWRHIGEISTAGSRVYSELKNICVWNKQLGGMGSLYRSQHELIFVFKNGDAAHINNVELGKHGRYRTNVWDYPGVHVSNHHRDDLKLHPTVKPVQMVTDAIIDCSKQGGIVLDCFAGSGSTLLAAEKSKRRAYVIEYEPKYCDVILYRFEKMTGIKPERVQEAAHV